MNPHLTYLLLLLSWSLPVLALHWLLGAGVLLRQRVALITSVATMTAYLSAVDAFAIHAGIWAINPARSLDLRLGSLVFEEALFFLLTSLMVVQSLILFLDAEVRRRGLQRVGRLSALARLAPRRRSRL